MKADIILLNKPTVVQQGLVRLSSYIGASKRTFICVKKDNKYYILDGSNRLFFLYLGDVVNIELIFIEYKNIKKYVCVVNSCDGNIDFIIKKNKAKLLKKYLSGNEKIMSLPDYFKGFFVKFYWNTLELKNVRISQKVEFEIYKRMVDDLPYDIEHWQLCQKCLDDEVATEFDYRIN